MVSPAERNGEVAAPEERNTLLEPQPCPDPNQQSYSRIQPTTTDAQITAVERLDGSLDALQLASSTPTPAPQSNFQESDPDATALVEPSLSSLTSSAHRPTLSDVTYGSIELLSPWFPRIDPTNKRAKTFWTWKSRREVVLWTAFTTIFIVFVVNLTLTILSWNRLSNDTPDKYLRNLYSGDCDIVKRASVLTHLLINILSTLMLSASNLCLQLIAAPSRIDINKAHQRRIWLDIGVPSLRNLKHISRWRCLVWGILATSSLPIHFLYNSAVFSSFTMNTYAELTVTGDFFAQPLSNETITGSGPLLPGSFSYNQTYGDARFSPIVNRLTSDYRDHAEAFSTVSTLQGLRVYSNPLVWRPNLFAIAANNNVSSLLPGAPNCSVLPCEVEANSRNASLLHWETYINGGIRGGGLCEWTDSRMVPRCYRLSDWTEDDARAWRMGSPYGFEIDHFLINRHPVTESELNQQRCHLQCSPVILLVVTIFNSLKCLCILWVIFSSDGDTICTLGDAIATFLERPDPITRDYGVASKDTATHKGKLSPSTEAERITAKLQPRLWARASSTRRWVWSILGFLLVITFALVCTVQGILIQKRYGGNTSFAGLYRLGFGTANFSELISWNQPEDGSRGLFANILIANVWQVLASLLYFVFNAILSCQLFSAEWAQYGHERKTLRVSHPRSIQRGSFFISMPLRYGLPIMAVFAVLHWLISQSAFVIRVMVFDWDGTSLPGLTMSGFSILPCLTSLLLGVLCFLAYFLNSYLRRYSCVPGQPFTSTCSLAISANCHRPAQDTDAHLLPVQWGIYEEDDRSGAKCAFTTSRYVRAPEVGDVLWGLPALPTNEAEKSKALRRIRRFWTQQWRRTLKKFRRQKDE